MSDINILEIEGLRKQYTGFALDNVNFSLPTGSIMGLIGENGAGKTTIIKLILNLIRRDSGSIRIFGLDNIKDEKEIKAQLGVVLDESCFHDTLNAKDISRMLKQIYNGQWDDPLYQQYLNRFSLPADKIVKEYSRGMKMKLSIAAALAHHPRLLILDEATSGLDPVVRNEILDVFFDFIQDESRAILMSSHITTDLERIADYITFISAGKIVFSDTKDNVLEHYGIVKCSASECGKLDRSQIVAVRKNSFGCEALTKNRREFKARYPEYTVDSATLDDIMLFYSKGEK